MRSYNELLPFEVNINIGFGIPIEFPSQRKKIFNSIHKQQIGRLWSSKPIEVKYNIRFEIPVKFPIKSKKKTYWKRSGSQLISLILLFLFHKFSLFQINISSFFHYNNCLVKLVYLLMDQQQNWTFYFI